MLAMPARAQFTAQYFSKLVLTLAAVKSREMKMRAVIDWITPAD
jgi:hypothetical protein